MASFQIIMVFLGSIPAVGPQYQMCFAISSFMLMHTFQTQLSYSSNSKD